MGDAQRECRCEECGAIFDNGLEWEKRNRKVHSRYMCETCHDTFSAAEEFEAHNFKLHPELQKFPR